VVVDDPDSLRQAVVADWYESHRAGEQALMVAAHRSEVHDLNDRARELLDADGCLGPTRLVVGGREFAEGDRVMAVGRNHYDLDILNGDLGTIERIDSYTLSVTFRCDRDGELRTMPTDRIEAGHLDHGYARTNHKAQGATVDRTFILGDDGDLDRQAAYTALSRGRLENRLYVVAPDADSADLELDARVHSGSAVERELTRDRSRRLADELLLHLPPASEAGPPVNVDDDLGIGIG
jgi:ATP-dependent exoDNAse (exonuclease V) alpha subunit